MANLLDFGTSALRSRLCFEDLEALGTREALHLRIGPAAGHRRVTYRDLRADVLSTAAGFVAAQAAPGERVALLWPPSYDLVVGFFAALHAGLVPSIIAWPTAKMDAEKYQRNLRAVLEGLSAHWLITDAATAERLGRSVGDARVMHAVPTGGNAPAPRVAISDTEPLFVQFSGGTTGTQKSVPISMRHLSAQLQSYASVLDLRADDRVISWLPLYHDMGLVACLLLPFFARIPLTMFSPMEWVMDPRPFLKAIGEDRATHCWLPNFAYAFLAKRAAVPPGSLDLSSLRAVVNCSEPVRSESMEVFRARFAPDRLRDDAVQTCYAMAESTFAVSQSRPADPPRRLSVSVLALGEGRLVPAETGGRDLVSSGRPIPGVEVRIADDSGNEQVEDRLGEIWIRGPAIMEDYVRPTGKEPVRAAFTGDWYRSGDLGFVRDGHVFVVGRKKDVIIVGGVNVYPEDVEAAASDVPGIHAGRAVAMGLYSEEAGTESLVLVAEVNDDKDLANARELEANVRSAVVAMVGSAPSRVFLVPPKWIVKSTAGKISRSETRARVLERWAELTRKP
jgi:acyl-CoA synthetase (AMP-forming)/AMP-acid ligase II